MLDEMTQTLGWRFDIDWDVRRTRFENPQHGCDLLPPFFHRDGNELVGKHTVTPNGACNPVGQPVEIAKGELLGAVDHRKVIRSFPRLTLDGMMGERVR